MCFTALVFSLEAVKFYFFCVCCVLLTVIYSKCVFCVYFVCIDQICFHFPKICQNVSDCQKCTYFHLIGLQGVLTVVCVFNLDFCYICVYFIPKFAKCIDPKGVILLLIFFRLPIRKCTLGRSLFQISLILFEFTNFDSKLKAKNADFYLPLVFIRSMICIQNSKITRSMICV